MQTPREIAESNVQRIAYHGWQHCLLVSNGVVDVIVVPAIGRVMQFRFSGDTSGPIWENAEIQGRTGGSQPGEWLNFGGNKTWPSPQDAWEKQTGRAWPPPAAFDSLPCQAAIDGRDIVMTSELDTHYGIRAVRRIRVVPERPQLEITTEFHKLAGAPVRVAVWVITQVREPERVFALLPGSTRADNRYIQQMGPQPRDLQRDGRLLSLRRDRREYVKIGTEATSLLWMDEKLALRVDAEDLPGEYPNGGSRTEIYTNPDPLCYVELETEGPLATLTAGEGLARTDVYTLFHRSMRNCKQEARQLFDLE